jgi:hypothetical protein
MSYYRRSIPGLRRVHRKTSSPRLLSNLSHGNHPIIASLYQYETKPLTPSITIGPSVSHSITQSIDLQRRQQSSSSSSTTHLMERDSAAKEATNKLMNLEEFPLGCFNNSTMREARELFEYWIRTYHEDGSNMASLILFRMLDEVKEGNSSPELISGMIQPVSFSIILFQLTSPFFNLRTILLFKDDQKLDSCCSKSVSFTHTQPCTICRRNHWEPNPIHSYITHSIQASHILVCSCHGTYSQTIDTPLFIHVCVK